MEDKKVIEPIFDEALKKYNDWKFKQRNPIKERYSPSDLSMNCKRFLFFGFAYSPADNDIPAQNCRTLELGNKIHDMFQYILKQWGGNIHIKSEHYFQTPLTPKDKDIIFSGSIDDIIMIPNKGMVILEYKSINGFAIKYLNGKPKPEHNAQIQMYMHYTGIHRGIIVYFDKNTSEIVEFRIKYDKDEALKWINFIKDTHYNYVNKFELPEIPNGYTKSSFPCSYCKYKKCCFEGVDWQSEYYKDKLKEYRGEQSKTISSNVDVSIEEENIEQDDFEKEENNIFSTPKKISDEELFNNGFL